MVKGLGLSVALTLLGCTAGGEGRDVSAADYAARGLVWPFTIDNGRIGCDQGFPYFERGGVRYALNGRGRGRWDYVEPLLKIDEPLARMLRRSDPGGYVPRIDPADVRREALALCELKAPIDAYFRALFPFIV